MSLEGSISVPTAYLESERGVSPVGKTFTWEVRNEGTIYTFTGVAAEVNGETTTFRLDDNRLVSTRPDDD